MLIITSLLDTDFYKLTMMQAVFHQFPNIDVEYTFKCRSEVNLLPLVDRIKEEIQELCRLRFTKEEISYLDSLGIFKEDYLDFLEGFRLDYSNVKIIVDDKFGLKIKGKWLNTILFETPILAIISELYCGDLLYSKLYCKNQIDPDIKRFYVRQANNRLKAKQKIAKKNNLKFVDFGTRRRYSKNWQRIVIGKLQKEIPEQFIGTSNIWLAKEFEINPIGTMAHEWLMAGQQLFLTFFSQIAMLKVWLEEYGSELGIALTDTINMNAFLYDFDIYLANKYQGCRQDSGDPIEWGEKLITHYEKLGIDSKTKIAIFSDNLTFSKMVKINSYFKDRINIIFGIGTNLTNDVGINPLNIVIKLTQVNGGPVAKISDSPEKCMCKDLEYVKRLMQPYLSTVNNPPFFTFLRACKTSN